MLFRTFPKHVSRIVGVPRLLLGTALNGQFLKVFEIWTGVKSKAKIKSQVQYFASTLLVLHNSVFKASHDFRGQDARINEIWEMVINTIISEIQVFARR